MIFCTLFHSFVLLSQPEEEEKEKEEPPPETIIDVEIPRVVCDLGREINFVKLPNFLSVETRPFDHETYEDEIDEEETLDEEGRARYDNAISLHTFCSLKLSGV